MVLSYKGRHIIDNRTIINYLQYVQSRRLRTPSMLRNPTHFEGEVRFIQAQDQQVTTHSLRKVTECLLTRSMLIKMYDIYSRFCAGAVISIRKYEDLYMILSLQ